MSADAEARLARVIDLLREDGRINERFVAEEAEAAASAGLAGGAMLAAACAGAGYGCEQDWDAALGFLAQAAELDDAQAQAQLRLLAGDTQGSAWRDLARRVDLAAWTAPRPGRSVLDRPQVAMRPGFIDRALCDWLIARAQPLMRASLVYDPVSGKPAASEARTNSVATFGLLELDMPLLLLRQRIANTLAVPAEHFERSSVFRYQPGQTFAPHADYLEPSPQLNEELRRRGQRPYTFLIYLNDDFDGGETHFIAAGRRFRGAAGEALYFRNVDAAGAPDTMSEHEGAPPTRGEKWLFSQFIRDKPQLPG